MKAILRTGATSVALLLANIFLSPTLAHSDEAVTLATATAVTQVIGETGVSRGTFKNHGLDVTLRKLTGGRDNIEALLGGNAQFAETSTAQFLAAASNDLPVVAIAVHSYGFFTKLLASKEYADLETLHDFKGKRLGIQVGTGAHAVFLMALEREGLSSSDFVISNIRVPDMPTAMAAGAFDAAFAWDPSAQRITELGLGVEVIGSREFEKMADVIYPFILMTTRKQIEDNPEMVQKFVKGFLDAKLIVNEERDATVDLYRSTLPEDISKATSDETIFNSIYSDLRYDLSEFKPNVLDELNRTAAFLVKQGNIKSAPDLSKSVDTQFVQDSGN